MERVGWAARGVHGSDPSVLVDAHRPRGLRSRAEPRPPEAVGCAKSIPAGGTAHASRASGSRTSIPTTPSTTKPSSHGSSPRKPTAGRSIAKISDGKGKVYFAWECVVRRSTVTACCERLLRSHLPGMEKDRNHDPPRQDLHDLLHASTSKPQVLTVTAWVGGCAPSGTSPCRFEAAATYLLH